MAFTNIMMRHKTAMLPAISEDGSDFDFPPPPQGVQHSHQSSEATTARPSETLSPTLGVGSYMSDDSGVSPVTDKFPPVGPPPKARFLDRFRGRRGGWRRFALIGLLAVLCIVGLVVGLVVGLRNRNSSSDDGSTTTPTMNLTFPAGSYRLDTSLLSANVSTSCTANSNTWSCYSGFPYTSFDWIIEPVAAGSSAYTVSTTNNPFAIQFTNQSLTLVDAGMATERYTFQLSMTKTTIVGVPLTAANLASTCRFNSTIFQASLYMRMPKSILTNGTSTMGTWPYAVDVQQVSSAAPSCADSQGTVVTGLIPQAVGLCSCDYRNFGV